MRTELTQTEAVLQYMQNGNTITPAKAQVEFNCWRLAAVIHKLRAMGHNIITINKRSYVGKQYAEYALVTTH